MTKDETRIKDWRSTGRRKARRSLFQSYVPFKCEDCGKTSKKAPKDAPTWFDEIWPEEKRVLDYSLQADHKSKDLTNNEVENLAWRCAPCHKLADNKTSVGESTIKHNFWGNDSATDLSESKFW